MIFNRRRRATPRLAPELDDADLGKVCRQLDVRNNARARPVVGPLVERLLKETGRDWDRRSHRLAVLASMTRPGAQESWAQQAPDSAEAMNLYAWGAMTRGARTPLSYDEVSAALDACRAAARLDPSDPSPWVAQLGLLRQWRRPTDEVFPVWDEIVSRDPWHREAHVQMFGYLSADECGSHAQAMEFVDQVRSSAPATAPTVALPLVSLVDRYFRLLAQGGLNAMMADQFWSGHEVDGVLRDGLTLWSRPGHLQHAEALRDLNLLAFALLAAKQTPLAAPVFEAIGGVVTPVPWGHGGQDPVDAFTRAWQRTDPAR
ncbi:hypothetical protein [Streptomyces arenae]|uniref:hypothetical protein n=1 Tax=Streptomyces arenae TaxID=29301 RepID=UPI0026583D12|nr:hypothetical protein [Streptomyces arenae]MCG7203694.1 hypothetical protein [Streptomyces arenae]